jgi:hypothetical protein
MPGYLVVQKGKVRQKKLLASGGRFWMALSRKKQARFPDLGGSQKVYDEKERK